MFEANEIFYIVLAFCAMWLTAFICWLMYQAAILLKGLHGLIDEVKARIAEVEEAIASMRRKFDGSLSVLSTVAEGVQTIRGFMKNFKRSAKDEDDEEADLNEE